ncbi:hypothetical protein COOONC_13433 [Cooperia oncophora]
MPQNEQISRMFTTLHFRMGRVGEKIYHVWQCDGVASGFLVHSCSVGDGRGERVDLIDVNGCAVDPAIQPDINYVDPNNAVVEVLGYKFSDASVLNYECVVEVCRTAEECEHLTPPKCNRENREMVFPSEPLRRARAADNGHKTSKIEVAATLTMEDTLDANTVTAEKDILALRNEQYTSVAPMLPRTVCFPALTILFAAVLLVFIFLTSTIAVFYIARYRTYVVNPKQ